MEEIKITLPKLGESITSANVVQWFKKEGDIVALDEPLLEVSTDKVNSEIPAPISGTLKKIIAPPESDVEVGAPLAILSTSEHIAGATTPTAPEETSTPHPGGESFYSPAVLRLARNAGIDIKNLAKIKATGFGGRLTKKDLEAYIEGAPEEEEPEDKHVKMTGMRKAIAANMVRSFQETPHASLVIDVDVTNILNRIKKDKEAFFKKHGFKLTITSFIAQAIGRAVKEFPLINSSLKDDTIVLKKSVNLGIAVSIEEGLIVPVIHNCHALSLEQIAGRVAELSERARKNKLSPDDVQNSTLTMSNFGMSGIEIGIPIIPHGETSIIGIGAIHKKVVPLEDNSIAIRSRMFLSLTFDHRVLDGMYGCGYLKAIKDHLEHDA
ncbi:MAG: Dihydrolipoyllysine-residue acetyltransferase component of pyruvate dehydrogenase complex [Chlamydiia bacterium]|nr:Dihydrolipoyllysine-residue acetyltransferase component of pyruvate dehydrogenase complex [Chlamydiia bacterium]MCH9616149.1 Dihydrolipoyllysine-residue acetyltransferase component of pyruvate dehydrogenase complex [Chlamydiia bacterium]MCH9629865.1 Dihydrolipoyllysine-residue acetyltransferase component of pyruvate dehydrogenase complex [Chlamydiia bacterium]